MCGCGSSVHTTYSPDAGMVGNFNLGPSDAYRFARGEQIQANNGMQVKLVRPLDFLVVADHSEYQGLMPLLRGGNWVSPRSRFAASWDVVFLQTAEGAMKKYLIERAIPGIEGSSAEDLQAAAARSNEVLEELGPDIQWLESYVVDDKTVCVYMARDEDIIREHAEKSGFPATTITEVKTMIGPGTAEA